MGFANQGEIKVTLEVSNKRRADVLHLLEKQTGMIFFYASNLFNTEQKISISAVDKTLDDVLDKVFEGTGMVWSYEREKFISIKPKKKIVVEDGLPADSNIVSIALTGKVMTIDGTPIPGATVRIKRTNEGSTTDSAGAFFISNTKKNDLLIASSVGFETRELVITGKSIIIKLNISINDLDETVVKGYYNTTKKLNTGSVTKISSKDISKQPVADPILALQAIVPGLQITQTSGIAGANIVVRLRGQNSIANGNDPLYIIDGIPFPSQSLTSKVVGGGATSLSPFANLSIANIESIEILKDADATAIYGSRGANGVILITTKRGNIGKTKVDVNINSGIGAVGSKIKLLKTEEYLKLRRLAFTNDGVSPQASDNDINGNWDTTRYTNWPKVIIGNTNKLINADVSISGGNELTQFLINGTYRNETTVFPGDFNDRRLSSLISLSNRSRNGKFKTTVTSSYSNDNNIIPLSDPTNSIFLAPNAPSIWNAEGQLNWEKDTWINPIGELQRKSISSTKNVMGNANLSYDVAPGLEVKSLFGFSNIQMKQSMTTPLTSYGPSYADKPYFRKNTQATNSINTWSFEPQVSFSRRILSGDLNILFGSTIQQTINESLVVAASNFPSDALIGDIGSATSLFSRSGYTQYRYISFFGRINYNFKERYLINLTARRDGSSRFGPGKRYGNFGAIGAGWIFTNENFFKSQSILSYGKVRASYGTAGNDQLSDYQYLSSYSSYNIPYLGATGLFPTRIANPYYNWESIRKLELGLELGILNNSVVLTTDFYENKTSNQLVGYSLPTLTGFGSVQANLPAVIKNWGVEFEVSTTILNKRGFNWKNSLTLTIPRNKLVSYPNLEASPYNNVYAEGRSLFIYKGFHYIGLEKATGVYAFEDVNNDGSITFYQDFTAYKEIARKFYGGFSNTLTLRGFQIDILFQFVKQNAINSLYYGFMPGEYNSNQPSNIFRRIENGEIGRVSQDYGGVSTSAYYNFIYSDGQIRDASYVSLKNINISYNLPENLFGSKFKVNSLLYIQAQNLFTISNYIGLNPETLSVSQLPPLRMVTLGYKLTF
ncbi:SusC/RagA family TonB-linked outer membrane protein [Chitinophaga rupis]|nr:SusC/RagA family TonB-linked outer membrane protein [Chitinophaga rupis]